jgi:holo-ACP synthase CitX
MSFILTQYDVCYACTGFYKIRGNTMKEEMKAIDLMTMLNERENRAKKQRLLREKTHSPLLFYAMNIPGPYKNSELIKKVFLLELDQILDLLEIDKTGIDYDATLPTGPVAYIPLGCDKSAQVYKKELLQFEAKSAIGAWLDLDVKEKDGTAVGRDELNYPPKKCFICNEPAKGCARSRRHSVAELTQATNRALEKYLSRYEKKE